jgi:hypothetical protein
MGTEMAACSVLGALGWSLTGMGAFVMVFYINTALGRLERSITAWRDGVLAQREDKPLNDGKPE